VGFWDGSGISWTIMQAICTSLQTDSHTNTSSLEFLQTGCSSWRPTNSVKALKACIIMQVKCFTARVPTALSDLALYMAPRLLPAFRSYSDFSRFFCLALDHCNKTVGIFLQNCPALFEIGLFVFVIYGSRFLCCVCCRPVKN